MDVCQLISPRSVLQGCTDRMLTLSLFVGYTSIQAEHDSWFPVAVKDAHLKAHCDILINQNLLSAVRMIEIMDENGNERKFILII